MSRLPHRPQLSWKDDGTPVDDRFGDIYYSVEDGLSESREVFLEACDLLNRLRGRDQFTVAELGFGTGLNFLALWDLWRRERSSSAWLNFVSFEGYPLDAADAERALSVWPELADLSRKLVDAWPHRAKGVHHYVWPDERLSLTLHIGLIQDTLPQSQFKADAWFLDGFSPAKNESMWSDTLWPLIAERSASGAMASTFTVAGAVRRGLSDAGFSVSKRPGHGRKRERLEAVLGEERARSETKKPPRVAVLGAGIAGACLAAILQARGANVSVFEKAQKPHQGASGNPMALVMPRIDADDTAQARFFIEAYNAARIFYKGLAGVEETEVLQRAKDDQDRKRFAKILADPPLGLEDLEAVPDGLLHKRALIIRPPDLIDALLAGTDVQWGKAGPDQLEDSEFDAVIYADGWRLAHRFPWLKLKSRAGQVDYVRDQTEVPASALASGHYALASERDRLWGATYRDHTGEGVGVSEDDRALNSDALRALSPFWSSAALACKVQSRAGVRATTPDRLPLIGPLPDIDRVLQTHAGLRSGQSVPDEIARQAGYYIAGGFGSRGFTFAPWAAQVITALLFEDPMPTQTQSLQLVDSVRQILRDLKRGQIA